METVLEDYRQVVLTDATVTASGSSMVAEDFGHKEITLFVNLTAAPTGTSPTITFTIEEVDPGNGSTPVGTSQTGAALTGVSTQIITLPVTYGGWILVTWTVTGSSPSFTGVYATLVNKGPSPAIYDQAQNGPVAVKPASTAATATDPALVVALSPNSPLPAGSNSIGTVVATQSTPANLQAEVGGLGAAGSAVVGNPVLVGGSDGTDTRTILTDSSGRQEVVGAAAAGSAVAGNPVLVAGSDGTDARTLSTDSSGHAIIVGDGTAGTPAGGVVSVQGVSGGTSLPISGTVTANQGTANTLANAWPTEITDGTHGPAAVKAASTAAVAADPSLVVALSPNSPLPAGSNSIGTVTATQSTPANLQAEVGGLGAAGSAVVGNPVLVGGSDGTDTRTILTDTSGRPEIVGAAASGSAVAGNPVLVGGSDGTDARTLSTDSSGHAIIVGDGTAGTPAGGVVSVQGVSGGTSLPISGTVTANQGTANSLSNAWPTEITDGTHGPAAVKAANTAAVASDPALVVAISPNNSISTSSTLLSDRTNSGSIAAANANVLLNTQGVGDVGITITGTWSATLTFQGTIDGTNWFAVQVMPLPVLSTSTTTSTTTTNAQFTAPVSGLNEFRVIATAYTSGTATVTLEGNQGFATVTGIITVQQGTAADLNATVAQGTAASLSGAWPTEITDGTHGPAAVKAASTAAAAADPSLVVALSPNSPLPAGTNAIGTVTATQTTPANLQAEVGGLGAAGSAVVGNPVLVGGSDGTDTRTLLTDTSGRPEIVGAAAAGSAVAGNPVLVGGSDGTDARTLSTDTSGHAIIVGDGTAGTPAGGVVSIQGVSGGQPVVDNLTQIAGNAVSTAASGVLKVGVVGNAGATLDATLVAGTAPTDGLGTLAQYNTTQPAPTNTQTVSIQSDQSGNLLEFPGVQTKTGTAWTSSTTVNTLQYPTGTATVGAPLGGEAVVVQLDQTTTLTAGAVTFQGTYDGTNWVTIPTAQILNPQTFAQLTNPYSFVASTNQPFLILLQGFQQIRLNLTTVITGTGSVTPYWTLIAAIGASATLAANQNVNLAEVAGSATATSATGVQKVGIVGNAGATLDATLAAGTAPTDGLGVLAQYNTTQPAPTNAQTVSIQSDQSANLLEFPGVQFKTGAAWTSATAVNTLQYVTGTATIGAPIGAQAVVVQLDMTTTLTAGAVTFQGSYDGTNWVTIPTGQILNPQTLATLTNPYSFVASTQQPFIILLQGFVQIRLNLTTVITGTGSVTPYWTVLSTFLTVPLDNGTLTAGTAPANGASVLAQYNTTQPAPTNAQTVSLQSDQSGNLLEFPGVQTKTGAAWTSATAVNTLQYPTGTTTIGAPLGIAGVIVQLDQTTTLTGGAVTFQGTYDGTNWVTIPSSQVLNPQTYAQLSNPYTFVASTQQPFLILLQGFQQIRLNLTTVITGTGSVTPYWTILSQVPSLVVTASSSSAATGIYSAAIRSLSPTSADPTDLITITGSATKTIHVMKIIWSAIQTTAASQEIDIVRRSSANSGGTSTTQTAIVYDTNYPAATATVLAYTVNPTTLGTTVGNMQSVKIFVPAGGTVLSEDYTFDFTDLGGIALRGTAQVLAVNWGNGAALTAGLNINATIEWTEE